MVKCYLYDAWNWFEIKQKLGVIFIPYTCHGSQISLTVTHKFLRFLLFRNTIIHFQTLRNRKQAVHNETKNEKEERWKINWRKNKMRNNSENAIIRWHFSRLRGQSVASGTVRCRNFVSSGLVVPANYRTRRNSVRSSWTLHFAVSAFHGLRKKTIRNGTTSSINHIARHRSGHLASLTDRIRALEKNTRSSRYVGVKMNWAVVWTRSPS